MNFHTSIHQNQEEVIGQIGWKYYNSIKKKAMEQEFSWTGFFLSMSIAFFVVIMAALTLSFFYQSLQEANLGLINYDYNEKRIEMESSTKIHYLEKVEQIRSELQLFV